MGTPSWELEERLWGQGLAPVAGIDEAGRGALAGPVVAAAVVLPPDRDYPFRDSKTLSASRRAELAVVIEQVAVAHAVAVASAAEVDELNVLQATKLASTRAIAALGVRPAALVTDYLRLGSGLPELPVARADDRSYQVAAASILAKCHRDDLMRELAATFPGYGFERHKGYGTKQHLAALGTLGPCPEHRRSFAGVAQPRLFASARPDGAG